jgi:hypothetical protein
MRKYGQGSVAFTEQRFSGRHQFQADEQTQPLAHGLKRRMIGQRPAAR